MLAIGVPINHKEFADEIPVNIPVNYEFAFTEHMLDPVYLLAIGRISTRAAQRKMAKLLAKKIVSGNTPACVARPVNARRRCSS